MKNNYLQKPAEFTEKQLIRAILSNQFPIDSTLPSERVLAMQLGVTRPTLREALQRLARDGWVEIRHGKSTRIQNYWKEGKLGVLAAIAERSDNLPSTFIPDLLNIRILLAPAYASLAIAQQSRKVLNFLNDYVTLKSLPKEYATFDWKLHHILTILSGNSIFTLILNGFKDIYQPMAAFYFGFKESRFASQEFYRQLLIAAQKEDPTNAANITRQAMKESLRLWNQYTETSKMDFAGWGEK